MGLPRASAASVETPSAFNPVSGYVQSYSPPEGRISPDQQQTLVFDIVGWKTGKDRKSPDAPLLGEATVVRHPAADGVRYEVTQRNGADDVLTGTFRCNASAFHSLVSWEYEHALGAQAANVAGWSRIRCEGECDGKKAVVRTNGSRSVTAVAAPLLCRWGLLDAAARMAELCSPTSRCSVLEVPSGLRHGQQFTEDRKVVLPGAVSSPIRTYLQTGPATLPTHWIVDEAGRPLFVTAFLTSWALKSIG
jgi:hypothetical protein